MQKWEYLRIVMPEDETLKRLGEEGWELVAVGGVPLYFIFKRPK
jgi:hypothetical protein